MPPRFSHMVRSPSARLEVPRRPARLPQRRRWQRELPAAGIVAFALASRLALAAFAWPATDSDEGFMGIMALHIAWRGAHPVFFYGQAYMGTLEAHLAAAFFAVFGASLFTLRFGTILMSTLALGCIYLLTRLLYSRTLAVVTLALLAVGTPEALYRELWTGGGYAETLLFGAAMMLLATWLALAAPVGNPTSRRWRLVAFAGWGLAAGLGLWSDVLVLPFALASVALLALVCRRELWGWGGAVLALGLCVGAFPLLAYAVTSPAHNPFAGAIGVQRDANAWRTNPLALVAGQLTGTLLVSLPTITGAGALFPLPRSEAWPLTTDHGLWPLLLTALRGLWGLGYLALLTLATRASVHRLLALRRTPGASRGGCAREVARLALAASAGLTLLLYASSPLAGRAPQNVSRYLIGLLIALPVVLAPLWERAAARTRPLSTIPRTPSPTRTTLLWRAALGVIALAFALGLAGILRAVPEAYAARERQQALVAGLERVGATAIYSDYWTCGWVVFLSDERIICGSTSATLGPEMDRYPPYRAVIQASPHPAYVFRRGSPAADAVEALARAAPGTYRHLPLGDYDVYLRR